MATTVRKTARKTATKASRKATAKTTGKKAGASASAKKSLTLPSLGDLKKLVGRLKLHPRGDHLAEQGDAANLAVDVTPRLNLPA